MEHAATQQAQGRRMLLLLLVLFALPVAVVLGMMRLDYRPGGSSHGTLIYPPRALQLDNLHDAQGQSIAPARLKAKWNLVYVARTNCETECMDGVRMLRQIHVALNKEIDRVQRLLVVPGPSDRAQLTQLQASYPDLVILPDDALLHQFTNVPPATVYLVDPLGNLMMAYPEGYSPKGLLADITRLLKYSWIG
jgi:cytochrome oxidase Cu insertion factor (SCO1/SenC/PrrC family)